MKFKDYVKEVHEAVPEMPNPRAQIIKYHAYGEAQGLIDDNDLQGIVRLLLEVQDPYEEGLKTWFEQLTDPNFVVEATIETFRQNPNMYIKN